jgi:aminoglycoside 2'-N-acetyltransferase I
VLVGHGSVIQRRMLYRGRALRAGYVEGVGVRADRRGRGYGRAMMAELERVIRGGYDLGVLGATDDAIRLYERGGWRRWEGRLAAITPDGMRPTPDEEGAVYVLEVAHPLNVANRLACDWRDGDVW